MALHQFHTRPGYEKVTSLNLPKIAPAKITVDLICLIKFSGISVFVICFELISILPLFLLILQPKIFKISKVILVSWILGILYNFVVSAFKIVAAIIGNDAFFDPEIFTSPWSLLPSLYYVWCHFVHPFFYSVWYILCWFFEKSEWRRDGWINIRFSFKLIQPSLFLLFSKNHKLFTQWTQFIVILYLG